MTCEHIDTCSFFEKLKLSDPFMELTVKWTYCNSNKLNCARYRLAQVLGGEEVPDHLWPNSEEEALEILKDVNLKHFRA